MKILYLTDSHIRANNPSSRKDNFYEAMLKKLRWIGEHIRDNNVDIVIHGGDWLNRPDISYSALKDIFYILKEWNVPIYTVLGNHDIYGYNPKTFDRTALSILCSFGLVKRLSSDPIIDREVSLTGVDAHYNLDKNGVVSDYVNVQGPENKVKIHVVHGFLDRKKWEMVPSTSIDDILHTDADIILTGHEHGGYGIVIKDKKIFINPGALARVSASIGDVNQNVKIAIIEVEGSHVETHLKSLPEDIALPAEDVIDRDKLLAEKAHIKKIEDFASQIQHIDDEELNFYAALESLCIKNNVDTKTFEKALEKLQQAEVLIGEENRKD